MKKTSLYILLYFVLYGSVFIFLIPPFEANDEPYHLEYINYVVKNSSLPNQLAENEKVKIEGHQFPLYYVVSASIVKLIWGNSPVKFTLVYNKKHFSAGGPENLVPVFNHVASNPFDGETSKTEFYFLRILSLVFGLINLFFIFKIAGLFFTDKRLINLCLLFAATIPQFAFVFSTITNDVLSNLFSTLSIYTFLIFLKNKTLKSIIIFSLIFSLCLLTKKTLFFLIPAVIISSLYAVYVNKTDMKIFLKFCFIVLIFVVGISGWFYTRNYLLYGEVFLSNIERITVPMHYDPKSIFSFYFIYPFLPGLFGSFFGVFGWMNAAVPFEVYVFYFILTAASVAGILRSLKKKILSSEKLFTASSILISFAGIVFYNLSYTQHQGRFLFPVLSLIVICIISGLRKFFQLINKNLTGKKILWVVCTALILIDLISVYSIYRFYYIQNNYL